MCGTAAENIKKLPQTGRTAVTGTEENVNSGYGKAKVAATKE